MTLEDKTQRLEKLMKILYMGFWPVCLSMYLPHKNLEKRTVLAHHRPATVIVNSRVLSEGGAHLLQMAWLHGKRAPLETQ